MKIPDRKTLEMWIEQIHTTFHRYTKPSVNETEQAYRHMCEAWGTDEHLRDPDGNFRRLDEMSGPELEDIIMVLRMPRKYWTERTKTMYDRALDRWSHESESS